MKQYFYRYYFRNKTILAFCSIAILTVLICSVPGYRFIKGLYLEEVTGRTGLLVRIFSSAADSSFTSLLQLGEPTETTRDFFKQQLLKAGATNRTDAFIFDSDYTMLIRASDNGQYGEQAESMLLYKTELDALPVDSIFISVPFKAPDGQWYLWGVKKLTTGEYFALKESAERLARVESFSFIFWIIGLVSLAVALLAAFLLARSVTGPVEMLVRYSHDIGKGKFAAAHPEKLQGELGLLANAMTLMKDELAGNQKERENMLAQIAHEIRNPLGGIELMAGLIKEDMLAAGLSEKYPERILREIAGLKELINAFLQYSKPKPAAPSTVQVAHVVRQIGDILFAEIKTRNIHFTYSGEQAVVYFDEEHLKQIVLNLCINSLQSVPDGGTISIKSSSSDGYWLLQVSDNGKGFLPEDAAKLFKPFFSTKKDGVGIGLAITRNLVLENKAEITAANNPGGGCTFTVEKRMAHAT